MPLCISGTLIPAAFLVSLGFLACHQAAAAVSILVLAMTFSAFHYNGYVVNHLDIAPKYAGVLMGFSNTVGLTAGVLAPLLLALIVPDVSPFSLVHSLTMNAI